MVGVYKTDQGKAYVLPSVKQVRFDHAKPDTSQTNNFIGEGEDV